MAELIDIVDEQDQPVRVASIQEARDTGSWHRYVRILVVDPVDRYLLQLRGPQNHIYPECWDFAAAGHVDVGESYEEAATREAAEEIGLVGVQLTKFESYKTQEQYAGQQLNRFNVTFKVEVPVGLMFITDPDEVLEARWYSLSEVTKLIGSSPDKVTPGLARHIKAILGRP